MRKYKAAVQLTHFEAVPLFFVFYAVFQTFLQKILVYTLCMCMVYVYCVCVYFFQALYMRFFPLTVFVVMYNNNIV